MGGETIEKVPGSETESPSHDRAYLRRNRTEADIFFGAPDPSIYMLGIPKSHPRFRSWFAVAVLAGILFALTIIYAMSL